MDFVPALALVALIKKFGDFLKAITNRDVNAIVTQLLLWAAAWGAVTLAAHTSWADGIKIGTSNLAHLNMLSQLFVALTIGSGAGVVHDATKAVDNSVDNKASSINKPLTKF